MIHLKSKWSRAPVRIFQMLYSSFLTNSIRNGPFAGIKILKNWTGSALLPKLLGTYESEISEIFKSLISNQRTDCFLDIGCAGGYYLVVAAGLRPDIDLMGVDASEAAFDQINRIKSELGHVISFQRKYANSLDILNVCRSYKSPLILIDIEGGEFSLLESLASMTDDISHASFIIELHNFHLSSNSFNPLQVFKNHEFQFVKFNSYGFDVTGYNIFDFFVLLRRHELRHPSTVYFVAVPKSI